MYLYLACMYVSQRLGSSLTYQALYGYSNAMKDKEQGGQSQRLRTLAKYELTAQQTTRIPNLTNTQAHINYLDNLKNLLQVGALYRSEILSSSQS